MINIGIVGLGFMAATHIKAYLKIPGARVAALCSPSGRNLDGDFSKVSGNVGDNDPLRLDMTGVKALRDFHQLLADPDIHLIDICSPTPTHRDLAVAALDAGRHVLCEKPLARTSAEARDIAAAAARAKGFFMPAMCMRFWPEWAWLKQAIDEGAYGKVLSARFRRVAEPPGWSHHNFLDGKRSGGALLDLHIHDTDFVQFCFGRPKAVFSTGYTKLSGAIDHVVTQYQVSSGASVHAEGGWAMTPGFGFSMTYTVNFENATADYDLSRGDDALRLFEQDQPARTIACEKNSGHFIELRCLIECIQSNRAPNVVTAEEGVSAIETCEAEEKSVQTGGPVTL